MIDKNDNGNNIYRSNYSKRADDLTGFLISIYYSLTMSARLSEVFCKLDYLSQLQKYPGYWFRVRLKVLENHCQAGKRSVIRKIKELKKVTLIEIENTNGAPNRYKLNYKIANKMINFYKNTKKVTGDKMSLPSDKKSPH